MAKVEAINTLKEKSVQNYFTLLKNQALTLAHSEQVNVAFDGFLIGFNNYVADEELSQLDLVKLKFGLKKYYENDVSNEYLKQNENKKINATAFFDQLTPTQFAIQSHYISENTNPLGSKHLLDSYEAKSPYNKLHATYHPDFREYLEKFEFYDIFLIDAETGNVIYTVYKELDFATSLKNGPYKDSGLARAFNKALDLKTQDQIVMDDYATYTPSYDGPAGFIAAPIFSGDKIKGVIAFQISFDKVNSYTLAKSGQEKMLETFLVGSDFKMRSDSTLDNTNRNVRSSFRKPETGSITSEIMKKIFEKQETVSYIGNSYLGQPAVINLKPMDVLGNKWVIETAYYTKEAFVSIVHMKWVFIVSILASSILISFFAIWFAKRLADALTRVTNELRKEAQTVGGTSSIIADVSSKLSEATTEQAASLQETVASIDEISAMVARNADRASSSAKSSEITTLSAQKGKDKVEQMLESINAISDGNDEIINQMQKSNREISDIVQVIQEISEKTKVINDIVFQTKLLSFNASIEAARAGEHGKGFAVVAVEVGNLASMSGKAADEISSMLSRSVKKVTDIVEGTKGLMDNLIRQSKQKVDFGTTTAKECAQALDEILSNVSSVNEMVREISEASNEQSTGVREVNKAMSELDQVTQSNSAIGNESSVTARGLKTQSERLTSLVDDLTVLVDGYKENSDPEVKATSGPKKNTLSIVKKEDIESSRKSDHNLGPSKRAVGLELTSTPTQNDPRFEDL